MQRRTLLASLAAAPLIARTARAAGSVVETRDGQRLFYREAGSGRPVLFIHGWTLSSEIWQGQFDRLAGQGLRAVAYDRRGHGQSSKAETGYDYDTLADDLASVIDRLDLSDLVLVGHSMGAGEVVRYLARHGSARIARVVLIAPTTPFPLKTADNPEGLERAMYDKAITNLKADRKAYMMAGMPGFIGRDAPAKLVDWAMTIALQASEQAEIACLRSLSETDFRPDMHAVDRPTMVVYGTADSPVIAVNSRRTQAAIPGSRLEAYAGAPHALFITHEERFDRELLAFARG